MNFGGIGCFEVKYIRNEVNAVSKENEEAAKNMKMNLWSLSS